MSNRFRLAAAALVALWTLAGCVAPAEPTAAAVKSWTSREAFERCTWDVNIEVGQEGVRLKKSVFLQDEQGQTHYNNTEVLSADLWAKKLFVIDDPRCDEARLFLYGSAEKARCNGTELTKSEVLPSTGCWHVWTLPPGALRRGLNEFVFSGPGSLVIEQSLYPNRSAKSPDGGKTWEFNQLGFGGVENGEYLVRLRLAQYPRTGTITSEVFDVASAGGGIHPCIAVRDVRLVADGLAELQVRSGPTWEPDASWTSWTAPTDDGYDTLPWQRFLQWRATLKTEDVMVTPVLKALTLRATVEPKPAPGSERPTRIEVIELTRPDRERRSQPFAHQPPGGRVDILRRNYKLDEVVEKGQTELEKLVLLREWARFSAPKGWDIGTAHWIPPWDALVILETNKKPIALCMCTHYATIFTQCAVALGYNARQVILDHHCVAEVWSNQFRKWILMDTGNSGDPTLNCHFEKDGVPLNALEMRRLWQAGTEQEIEVVYTPPRGRISADNLKDKDQCGLANLRRFGIPFRNNHLVTPFPGELEHGEAYNYADVYLWWDDAAAPVVSPEYGNTSCRPGDFYWTLNETGIDLEETDGPNALHVTLDTVTPNFQKFLVSIDGGEWQAQSASFAWELHRGENTLKAKALNAFGAAGAESVARLRVE